MPPSLAILSTLLLACCAAHAGRNAQAESGSSTWEEPALDPGEGSLWDNIEDALGGQAPPEEVVQASGELAAERDAELDFLETTESRSLELARSWYGDPHAFLTADPLYLDRVDAQEFDLPIVLNEQVELWLRYFLGSGRRYYARWLARSTRYRPMIEAGLAERGMPADIFYLAMIESGFSPNAYSKAAAVGLWQFISSTGRAYDLRVEWWLDERRDPEKATDAALDHLQDLHEIFGDWYLAAAAYNAGAGRVRGALRKTGASDYWGAAQPGALARETRNYVPKLIAAAIIGHHPERYGFTAIDYADELAYDTVPAPHSSSMEAMAACADLSEVDFQALNPALRRWALPPEPVSYPVHVPPGRADEAAACFAAIPPSERVTFQRHTVARGESLGSIARRYSVSVGEIARMNKIRNRNRIYVGTELVIPVPGLPPSAGAPGSDAPSAGSGQASSGGTGGAVTWHTVRSGENLASIARRYKVRTDDLMAWNDIKDADLIKAGRRLRVQGGASPVATTLQYAVRSGDTLSSIAASFGVSVADLQRWNGIRDASRIHVGQRLTVHSDAAEWTLYIVKGGDTLGAIAEHHGCTVAELKSWNTLSSNTIHPGQQLRMQR